MFKNNGWIYLIVYFIMFPLGFQVSKILDQWLNDINEQISGMHIFYLWLLVSGVLAALFLLVMLLLHRRLVVKYPACPWLSSAVCAFHLVLGVLIGMAVPAQALIMLFCYMFSTRYVILLVMLLTFLVADLVAGRRRRLSDMENAKGE